MQVVKDTIPPQIVDTNPPEDGIRGQAFRAITVSFSKPIDPATVNAQNFQLIAPDGTTVDPTDIQFRLGSRFVQLTYPTLTGGANQFVIHAANVTDIAGNALGVTDIIRHFTIKQATAVWINPAGGNWDDPTNWDTGKVPGPTDDVLLDNSTGIITYRSGNTEIRSLSSNARLTITGGTLTIDETVQVNNTFTLAGGTLKDATVLKGTGGQGIIASSSGGTLDGVTANSDLDLTANSTGVTIVNGLTLNGTATLVRMPC